MPLFLSILSSLFAAIVGPGLLPLERLRGKASYSRAEPCVFVPAGNHHRGKRRERRFELVSHPCAADRNPGFTAVTAVEVRTPSTV